MFVDSLSNEEISTRQAWEILTSEKSILIDVRTQEECLSVGVPHLVNFINIPIKLLPDMSFNPNFIQLVINNIQNLDTKILFICRAGFRSRIATHMLQELGYSNCFNIYDGFEGEINSCNLRGFINGWIFEKLPWRTI